MAVRALPDPEAAARPASANTLWRRTADARDRPGADDAAEDPDTGRADARPCARHSRTIVESTGEAAPDHVDHGVARRAERDLRTAPCRPRLCAGACADRLGRR